MRLFGLIIMILCSIQASAQQIDSTEYYVKALIERTKTETDYITNETYDLMGKLIRLEIKNNYQDSLKLDLIPGHFEISVNGTDTTFYQVAPLKWDKSLLIWAKKNKFQEWTVFSHYEQNIHEHTQFKYIYKNELNFFIAPSFCILGKTDNRNWQRINFEPSNKNDYLQIYRWCNNLNDKNKFCTSYSTNSNSFPEINELQTQMTRALTDSKNLSRNHETVDSFQTLIENRIRETIEKQGHSITLTVSNLTFTDIDHDEQEEIFWFSVSDCKLNDFKLYYLTDKGLIEQTSDNYVDYLKETEYYEKLCELSGLTLYQPKSIKNE